MKRHRAPHWLSADEHRAIATRLLRAIQEVGEIGKRASETYGFSSPIGKLGARLYVTGGRSQLQALRSLFDDAWYREGHERDGAPNPYYGASAQIPARRENLDEHAERTRALLDPRGPAT
jgi:hypothetical protein